MAEKSQPAAADTAPVNPVPKSSEPVSPDPVTVSEKPKSKKKWIIIIGIIALFLCCCLSIGGVTAFGGGLLGEESEQIQTLVSEVCNSGDFATNESATLWFTYQFQTTYSQEEAGVLVVEAFPASFDCSELKTDGFLDMITSGQSVAVSTVNGETTGEFTFNNGNDTVTVHLEKEDGEWLISDLSI